ncbi:FecR domain-containing protein [Labilithrix luteola]|nr:outer membrane protein assembly factor BamD [Labilithrix luteola]
MPSCNRLWEVDALREGRLGTSDEESFLRHRRTCEECRARLSEDERLRDLGRALPVVAPNELAARRMRGNILHRSAGAPTTRGRSRMALAITAASLVAIGAFAGHSHFARRNAISERPNLDEVQSVVMPTPGTDWRRERDGNVERIRIGEGTVTLEVRHQTPGRRFFVDTPDAEIEVRGTRFEVVVANHATRRVRVFEGLVALRRHGDEERRLGANETWESTFETTSIPAPPTPSAVASTAPARKPKPSSLADAGTDDTTSAEYRHAMDLYGAGDYESAAREFHAFAARHPSSPESEDAAFLEAVALTRGARADAAAVVAERFLSRYPTSFHAKDAAIIVARAARVRGDCAKAREALTRWPASSSDVRSALGSCAEPTSVDR